MKMLLKKQMDPIEYALKQSGVDDAQTPFRICDDNVWGIKLKPEKKDSEKSGDQNPQKLNKVTK